MEEKRVNLRFVERVGETIEILEKLEDGTLLVFLRLKFQNKEEAIRAAEAMRNLVNFLGNRPIEVMENYYSEKEAKVLKERIRLSEKAAESLSQDLKRAVKELEMRPTVKDMKEAAQKIATLESSLADSRGERDHASKEISRLQGVIWRKEDEFDTACSFVRLLLGKGEV